MWGTILNQAFSDASLRSCHFTKDLKEISQLIKPNPNSVAIGHFCFFVVGFCVLFFLLKLGPIPEAHSKSV